MKKRSLQWLVSFMLILTAVSLYAQPKDNSPYSRLGLGDLVQQQFGASRGFAGLSAAYQHPFHINVDNPASLAFLNSTAFEIGIYAKYANLENGALNTEVVSGNLRYMALAFPLQNSINRQLERDKNPFRWGMNLALIPYTQVSYNLITNRQTDEIGNTVNLYSGEGGTYRFVWGNGIRYNNFAFGVNTGFLFGNIIRNSQTTFSDISVSYDDLFEDDYSVSGIIWNFGAQYKHDFKSPNEKGQLEPNGKSVVIGAFGNSKNGYKTKSDKFYRGISGITGGVDTALYQVNVAGEGKLPSEFTVGLMYKNINKLRLGAEFGVENWSEYENSVERGALENAYTLAIGGEIVPDAKSYNSYLKRVSYRFGYRFGTDPRGTDGNLKYSSVTLGFGLPIISKGSQSYVDWAFEFGRFGVDEGLKESFIRLTAGFTLNDSSWFFKRKYN